MWIVYTLVGNGLSDDLYDVIGPFANEEEAKRYSEQLTFIASYMRGVLKVTSPHAVLKPKGGTYI